jgi:hypothetical protein
MFLFCVVAFIVLTLVLDCFCEVGPSYRKLDIYSDMPEDNTEIQKLLESRHTTMLEWKEPWPACGPEGNKLDAHITLRASVHDCINLQRAADQQAGRTTEGKDLERLEDFILVHWADIVQSEKA